MCVLYNAGMLFPSLLGMCLAMSDVSAQGPDKKKPEPAWGPIVEGFRMSLQSAKSEFAPKAKAVVQIVLQNADSKDRLVVVSETLRYHKFSVTQANGMAVPMTIRGKKLLESAFEGSNDFRTLKPGEQVSDELDVSEVFDMKMPGEYRIVVSHDVWNRDDDKKFSTVTSNTLVIKITEAPAKKDK